MKFSTLPADYVLPGDEEAASLSPDMNPLPALDAATYEALRDSMRRYGMLVPIVVDPDGNVLDGHHRLKILRESITDAGDDGWVSDIPWSYGPWSSWECLVLAEGPWMPPPKVKRTDPTWVDSITEALGLPPGSLHCDWENVDDYDPADIIRTLNLDRRQLTPKQREAVIVHLRKNGHSVRAIARAAGISKSQVQREVSRAGQLTPPKTVTGDDGKQYPSRRPTKPIVRHVVDHPPDTTEPLPDGDPIDEPPWDYGDDDDVAEGEIVDGNRCNTCNEPVSHQRFRCADCSEHAKGQEALGDVARIEAKLDRWTDLRIHFDPELRVRLRDRWQAVSERAAAIADQLDE